MSPIRIIFDLKIDALSINFAKSCKKEMYICLCGKYDKLNKRGFSIKLWLTKIHKNSNLEFIGISSSLTLTLKVFGTRNRRPSLFDVFLSRGTISKQFSSGFKKI